MRGIVELFDKLHLKISGAPKTPKVIVLSFTVSSRAIDNTNSNSVVCYVVDDRYYVIIHILYFSQYIHINRLI